MDNPTLPPWGDDPLSAFIADAQDNEQKSALNMPDIFTVLQRVRAALQKMEEITERENNPNLLPTRFLMARSHGAWLGAVRLGLSTQTAEAYPVVRAIIENAWYALHIAKDPAPPARAEIWLRRGESEQAKKACKDEFTIANVRATHRALDATTEKALHTLYERTIDYGGHPNEQGVFATTIRTDDGFGAVFLTNNPVTIAVALKNAIEVALGALRVFRLVFPERYAITGLDEEIARLVDEVNAVFGARAAVLKSATAG